MLNNFQYQNSPPTTTMEPPEHHHHQPNVGFIKLLSLQSDIISDILLSLTSPFTNIFSFASTAFSRLEDTKPTEDSAVPSTAVNGSSILLKKAVLGFVSAAYVFLVLTTVMAVSTVVGVCLVRLWVEEPVQITQKLYFDYTNPHPSAVFDFGFHHHHHHHHKRHNKLQRALPVGHTCNVRLVFVMPESDYNREIGMFQVVATSLSSNEDVISSSSFPWMLRFRSQPIRAMHTLLMGAPLLLGITSEIQTVSIPLLRYKERHYPRTQYIKVTLAPRAGMPFLPQIYEAELIVTSELPWMKRLVRNWKWTFYVWTSLYVYLMLVLVLVSFFRSIMFPALTTVSGYRRLAVSDDLMEEPRPRVVVGARGGPSSSGTLRRWRESRNKRKAMLLGGGFPESMAGSDATSMSVTRDEDTSMTTEEVGDSESIS